MADIWNGPAQGTESFICGIGLYLQGDSVRIESNCGTSSWRPRIGPCAKTPHVCSQK